MLKGLAIHTSLSHIQSLSDECNLLWQACLTFTTSTNSYFMLVLVVAYLLPVGTQL